jgi:hypothetical protein
MGVKDKRRYVCGGFPPVGNFYIQQDSYLICDDLVEELATISTSTIKQKMRNIDNLLDASAVFYGTFGTFNINTFPRRMIGSNNWRKLHGMPMRRRYRK